MIVLAIIAIIAAITYPSYERSVLKSHRADVQSLLTQDAQILERCYTQNFSYTTGANGVSCSPAITSYSRNGYYELTTATAVTTNTYSLSAAAVGTQQKDTPCRTFTITNTGQKTALDASGGDNTAACWSN